MTKTINLPRSNLEFKTQTSAINHTQNVLERLSVNITERFKTRRETHVNVYLNSTDSDFNFLWDLIERHYQLSLICKEGEPHYFRISYRTCEGLSRYSRCTDVSFKNAKDPAEIKEKDWMNFSYRRCIRNDDTNVKTNLARVARNLIDIQIASYIEERSLAKTYTCCDCCNSKAKKVEVDHIIPFKNLLQTFCEENNIKSVTDLYPDYFSEKWKSYHKEHAKFQMLCKRCHKGKTQKIPPIINFNN